MAKTEALSLPGNNKKKRTVTLEEHFTTPDLQKATAAFLPDTPVMKKLQAKLVDLGEGRLAAMDEAGVDLQVLSAGGLGLEQLKVDDCTALLHDANDALFGTIKANPDRFDGFATLNLRQPEVAAQEMERCVATLRFKGALLHGLSGGGFLDEPKFSPIFEAAESLGVPLYLHPAPPPQGVFDSYFADLPQELGRALSTAAWGWHAEVGLHVLRLIGNGLFDRFPNQQVIIGHMGEDLPFSLARAESVLGDSTKHLQRRVGEYFHNNFHVTSSGYFTLPPFRCAFDVVGEDRFLYSVDYPYSDMTVGKSFLEQLPVSSAQYLKFTHANAEALLRL